MPLVPARTLVVVYGIMLMDTLNFGIIFPLLPSIAAEFGQNTSGLSMMATSFSLCQMLAMPVLGRLSDRVGRRVVLIVSLCGSALSSFGIGFAQSFPLVVVARCLNGISGGTMGVVNAYVADVTTPEERSTYMSYASSANSLGIILGPALGGFMSQWGFKSACFASGALALLNLVFALPCLTESRWIRSSTDAAQRLACSGDSALQQSPTTPRVPCQVLYLYGAGFMLVSGFAALETIVGFYLYDAFGDFFDHDRVRVAQFYAMCFTVNGFVIFAVSLFIYKPARRFLGEASCLTFGALLRAVAYLCQAVAPSPGWLCAAMCGTVAGNQFIFPSVSSTITSLCHRDIYGRALGYHQTSQALARVVAPPLFSWAYEHVSHEFSFYACSATTLVAGALILTATQLAAGMAARGELQSHGAGPVFASQPAGGTPAVSGPACSGRGHADAASFYSGPSAPDSRSLGSFAVPLSTEGTPPHTPVQLVDPTAPAKSV